MHRSTQIQLQERAPRVRNREPGRRPVRQAAKDAKQHGSGNSDQDRAIDLAGHQDQRENESEACDLDFGERQAPDSNKSCRIGDDQLRIAQAYERDEHSNTGSG